MADKADKAGLLEQVNACKERIAKERDTLRDLIDDAESIANDCDEAIDSLETATDTLSRYL